MASTLRTVPISVLLCHKFGGGRHQALPRQYDRAQYEAVEEQLAQSGHRLLEGPQLVAAHVELGRELCQRRFPANRLCPYLGTLNMRSVSVLIPTNM